MRETGCVSCRLFIGVRHFWKVFGEAGIISRDLLGQIYQNDWSREVLWRINSEMSESGFYLTNLVKCCQNNSSYPSREEVNVQLQLLVEELNILRPKNIICFGLLPLKVLTGRSVKLGSYAKDLMSNRFAGFNPTLPLNFPTKAYPCYFPAGRGNPKMAAEMLNYYRLNL